MDKINNKGIIAGTIAWLGFMAFAVSQLACLKYNQCGGDDIFLAAIIGVGLLAPAYFVAFIASYSAPANDSCLSSKKRKADDID